MNKLCNFLAATMLICPLEACGSTVESTQTDIVDTLHVEDTLY